MYLNKVLLIGNLTKDPDLKALPSGIKVTSFGLATNRSWKDQNGARQEAVEYHNLVAFGKQAETIKQYCRKGSSLMIEGRIQTRSWETDGKKNYKTEIIVENFQFGPKTGVSSSSPSPSNPSSHSDAEDSQKDVPPDLDTVEYPDEEINLEDIPF
jgi:single-strand DNA-binding protein